MLVVHVSKCETKEAAKRAFAELEKVGFWRFMRRVSLYFLFYIFYFFNLLFLFHAVLYLLVSCGEAGVWGLGFVGH